MSDPTREDLTDLTMHAALDGELDAMGMMEFERSLAGNADLAARYEKLVALRAALAPMRVISVRPTHCARGRRHGVG